MQRTSRALMTLALSSCTPAAAQLSLEPDPAHTDGDKYHVILDNEQIRVLRYQDSPGDKTHLHHHPDFVLYPLAPFRRRLTMADGSQRERAFQAGEVAWVPAQSHVGENIGTTATDALLVEIKPPKH